MHLSAGQLTTVRQALAEAIQARHEFPFGVYCDSPIALDARAYERLIADLDEHQGLISPTGR